MHGLLDLLVQELSRSPATVSPQTLSTKAVVASLNLFARARVIGPMANSRGSSLAANNSGGVVVSGGHTCMHGRKLMQVHVGLGAMYEEVHVELRFNGRHLREYMYWRCSCK